MLDGGVGALPKVVDAYMDKAALAIGPSRSIIGNLLRIVIMLFWQHKEQLKSGLS